VRPDAAAVHSDTEVMALASRDLLLASVFSGGGASVACRNRGGRRMRWRKRRGGEERPAVGVAVEGVLDASGYAECSRVWLSVGDSLPVLDVEVTGREMLPMLGDLGARLGRPLPYRIAYLVRSWELAGCRGCSHASKTWVLAIAHRTVISGGLVVGPRRTQLLPHPDSRRWW
jgi:hypothetical protein